MCKCLMCTYIQFYLFFITNFYTIHVYKMFEKIFKSKIQMERKTKLNNGIYAYVYIMFTSKSLELYQVD